MRLDNLFRLKDDSLALVDYESTYDYEDKIKYLNYIVRTLKRCKVFKDSRQVIRMIVIYTGESLLEQEQMQFIILPLIYKGIEEKQNCIQRCFEMGKRIESREIQTFVFTGLLVFTDKVIRREDSEKIRRWLEMTQVGQIIEEEIQQAVAEVRRQADEEKKEAVQSASKNANYSTAQKMLACGISIDQILQCIDGLTRRELEAMK
ncbi:hypothetical protein [Blautia sp. MSJ-19]|uniref:hypothetical protein n=1 Tax=Blautia sp. MSJ-19 TaxID=2841517 RepID=UPI001C0EB9D3|nr:hypothetical protein [Blautia sp. MSJ-19]MBU5480305.1 hypothetical protein [Blautia sp. MSJ-19]